MPIYDAGQNFGARGFDGALPALRRLLRPELQCATNLVVRVAPLVEREIRKAGYSWTADYLHALLAVELAEFIVPLSEMVLSELGSVVLGLVERNEVTPEQVHDLLFGEAGLRAANAAMLRTLKRMRIWYRTDGRLMQAAGSRRRDHERMAKAQTTRRRDCATRTRRIRLAAGASGECGGKLGMA